jgi:hypothetical protein
MLTGLFEFIDFLPAIVSAIRQRAHLSILCRVPVSVDRVEPFEVESRTNKLGLPRTRAIALSVSTRHPSVPILKLSHHGPRYTSKPAETTATMSPCR